MLGKAWEWLTARLSGQRQGRLRFAVHRDPAYQSFWHSSDETEKAAPRLEIQIYLEASNMTNVPRWIATAEIEGMPSAKTTVIIGVRDPGTGRFAPKNPLPP